MKYTENYNLLLPEETDFVDVLNINQNMEILDRQLFGKADANNTAKESTLAEVSNKIGTAVDLSTSETIFGCLKNLYEKSFFPAVKRVQRGVVLIDQSTVTSETGNCFLHVNISRTSNLEKTFVTVGAPSEKNTEWGLSNVKAGAAAAVVLVNEWTIRIATTYNGGVSLYVPWQVIEFY